MDNRIATAKPPKNSSDLRNFDFSFFFKPRSNRLLDKNAPYNMNHEVKKKYDRIENANSIIKKNAISNITGSDKKKINNTFHGATSCTSFFENKENKNKYIKKVKNGKNEINPTNRVYSNCTSPTPIRSHTTKTKYLQLPLKNNFFKLSIVSIILTPNQ